MNFSFLKSIFAWSELLLDTTVLYHLTLAVNLSRWRESWRGHWITHQYYAYLWINMQMYIVNVRSGDGAQLNWVTGVCFWQVYLFTMIFLELCLMIPIRQAILYPVLRPLCSSCFKIFHIFFELHSPFCEKNTKMALRGQLSLGPRRLDYCLQW